MSDLLGIGSSGVLAYQYALTATSNNIANAAVEGYSRQEVELGTVLPRQVGVQYFGAGVYAEGVRRQYNEFIEANLRRSHSELEGQTPLVNYANRVFDLLGSQQLGLSTAFSAFFAAVRALAVEPASLITRSTMLREADGVAAGMRQVTRQLDLFAEETYQGLLSTTARVNAIGSQLAALNGVLARKSSLDDQAPEMLDQRDTLLRELSKLIQIKTAFEPNGQVKVSLNDSLDVDTGGAVIVARTIATPAQLTLDSASGRVGMVLNPNTNKARLVAGITGGELGGLLAFREQVLVPVKSRLNDLAVSFAESVNAAQRAGIDMRGAPGEALYSFDPALGAAASLSLAMADPQRIAAGAALRVIAGNQNVSAGRVEVGFEPSTLAEPSGLTDLFAPTGVCSASEAVSTLTTAASLPYGQLVDAAKSYKSLLAIPAGVQDVAIALDTETGQWPHLFTRDGRHLLGMALEPDVVASVMTSESMLPGAQYSAAYLNESGSAAYLGANYFIGARAEATRTPVYDVTGEDHQILRYDAVPARLQGRPLADTTSEITIAAGALVLNDVALDAFEGVPSAANLAQWLNAQSAATGVTAAIVDQSGQTLPEGEASIGRSSLLLTLADGSTASVQLTFGANGSPSDLAHLGMRTFLHWDGAVPEDLIVMVTATGNDVRRVSLGAEYVGAPGDPLESLRERSFDIAFDDTGASYAITDVATGTVVAERRYEPAVDGGRITYRGAVLTFSTLPRPGDRFRLDANRDGFGDNANLLALAELEYRRLESGYTIPESYVELASRIGNVAQQATISQDALAVVLDQAVLARDQVSGVSLDVEASNLIRFQQAYQANAKVMQVATDLFDRILSLG